MAALNKPRGLLQTIIASAAERISMHPSIPEENRAVLRDAALRVIEQQISAVIGFDSIKISGWAIPPSQRMDRRERILAALHAGESVKAIAGRDAVSPALREVFDINEPSVSVTLLGYVAACFYAVGWVARQGG